MDQELIAYFDRRFEETSRQITELRQETAQQFEQARQETAQQFKQVRQETAQQFKQVRQETSQRFETVEAEIRGNRVMLEDLRGQIQGVAEGVSMVDQKLDHYRLDTAREMEEIRSFHRVSYRDLDRRVSRLETQIGAPELSGGGV